LRKKVIKTDFFQKIIQFIGKIKPEQILPIVLIIIDIAAAIVCCVQKEHKKALYWFAAAVLNITVTF